MSALVIGAMLLASASVRAQGVDALVLEARKSWDAKDAPRLAELREQAIAASHPLAPWFDYWALNARLGEATVDDLTDPALLGTVGQLEPGAPHRLDRVVAGRTAEDEADRR